ncbi:unnamed protein product [Polarella glacialis]|nr:unnamed protein product [Polarella glacialis]
MPTASRFDPASAAKVLDLKGVLSPPRFPASDRAESEFGSWRYGFTSAMALIGLDVALEDAETNRTEPELAAVGQLHWAEARFLHALLTALCRGTPLMTYRDEEGDECILIQKSIVGALTGTSQEKIWFQVYLSREDRSMVRPWKLRKFQ